MPDAFVVSHNKFVFGPTSVLGFCDIHPNVSITQYLVLFSDSLGP